MILTEQVSERAVLRELSNYEANREQEWRSGRTDRLINRIAIDTSLRSNALSPRDRQMVAFIMCQLTQMECAHVLGITQQSVAERLDRCISAICNVINDTYKPRSQKVRDKDFIHSIGPDFDKWMIDVLHNTGDWWRVPPRVRTAVRLHFGLNSASIGRFDYDRESTHEYKSMDTLSPDWEVLMEQPDLRVRVGTHKQRRFREYTGGEDGRFTRKRFNVHMPNDKYIVKDKWDWKYDENL